MMRNNVEGMTNRHFMKQEKMSIQNTLHNEPVAICDRFIGLKHS